MARLPTSADWNRRAPQAVEKRAGDISVRPIDTQSLDNANINVGRAISRAGTDVFNVQQAIAEQDARDRAALKVETDRLDTLRVEEAYNQFSAVKQKLTLDPESGYANIKGSNVINRKTPLLEEYPRLLEGEAKRIEDSLHTPAQREKFKLRVDASSLDFKAGLLKHIAGETDKYKEDAFNGTVDVEAQAASTNWSDGVALDRSKARIAAVADDAYSDKPPEFKQAKIQDSYQKLNGAVVSNAISAGQYAYAEQYIANNTSQISVSDAVKFSADIKKAKETDLIGATVDSVIKSTPSMIQPDGADRLLGIIAKAGAPGAGMSIEGNMSERDKGLVAKDFMREMVTRYKGDLGKAIAAYHSDPKIVADAEKQAAKSTTGQRWSDFLPQETKEYVNKISESFMSGENPIPEPTVVDIKEAVAAKLKGQPRDVIERAQAKAETAFNDIKQAQNQKSDNLLSNIMTRVDSGQITKLSDLTPDELVTLGTKRTSARTYIESASKREQDLLELSPAATSIYYSLYTDPVALTSKSIPEIMEYSKDLGRSRTNALLQKRAEYINRPETQKAATVDADQFKALAIKFGFNLNNDKTKKDLILIKDRTEQAINELQVNGKKTLTRDEKETVIKRMMVEFPQIKVKREGRWGIFGGEDTTISKRGYEVENPRNIVVPDDFRGKVIQSYMKHANRPPTDAEIRDSYAEWLAASKGL